MYAIYGNIYHKYTPVMLAYIAAPWIRHGLDPENPTNVKQCHKPFIVHLHLKHSDFPVRYVNVYQAG